MMIIILIIVGLGAGFMILSSLTKDKKGQIPFKDETGGDGGYTGGNVSINIPGVTPGAPSAPSGGFIASLTTKTILGNKMSFFRYMDNYCKGYDWNKFIPFTMVALETNWAKSCYFHNLFNITTQSTDPKQFFKYPSIPSLKFKMYLGFEESVAHFWNLLKLTRYEIAYQNRQNPEQCITELIKAGYAGDVTDPARYLVRLDQVRSKWNSYYG